MQGNEKVEERKAEALEGKGRRKGWKAKKKGELYEYEAKAGRDICKGEWEKGKEEEG